MLSVMQIKGVFRLLPSLQSCMQLQNEQSCHLGRLHNLLYTINHMIYCHFTFLFINNFDFTVSEK